MRCLPLVLLLALASSARAAPVVQAPPAGRAPPADQAPRAGQTPRAVQAPPAVPPPPAVTLCAAMEAAAGRAALPFPFFARLIWQESRFNPRARSPAGAQGVAQFMPATAVDRGLADPFDTATAIDASAAYLRSLRDQFGTFGLAAAAYNAGPGRLSRWMAGTASLPQETIDYVRIVTGHDVEAWRGLKPPDLDPEPAFSCLALSRDAGRRATLVSTGGASEGPPPKAWSVILVGALNRAAALREYEIVRASHIPVLGGLIPTIRHRRIGGQPTLRYVAQIEQDDRASSERLCKQLERAGGACVVLRNAGR